MEKLKKKLHLKIAVPWQGGVSGLAIQNNSVTPRKTGHFFLLKEMSDTAFARKIMQMVQRTFTHKFPISCCSTGEPI